MSDSYRPSYHNAPPPGFQRTYTAPVHPPPGQAYPPLPHGPPPPMCQFGLTPHAPNAGPSRYQHNNFGFTAINAIPQYPEHVPTNGYQYGGGQDPRRRDTNRDGRNAHRPYRGRGGVRVAPSDRPLLTFQRGNTPEQLSGMNDDLNTEQRFLDIDDMSDSAEESMQESDTGGDDSNVSSQDERAADDDEPLSKKKKLSSNEDATAVPKWSNPETYTALPPPDESIRKKKDVVKLIRKARVAVEKEKNGPSQVATNDDFISFNFNDNAQDAQHAEVPFASGEGMPGAPTGPRSSNETGTRPEKQVLQDSVLNNNNEPFELEARDSMARGGSDRIIEKLSETKKRKRASESPEPLDLREPKRKKGAQPFSGGYVLEEWLSPEPTNPVPWITTPHQFTENGGFRLHKEICDFYDFVRPHDFEEAMRSDLLQRLQNFISSWKPGCKVYCFGSFAAGLYLPSADMDVVVVSNQFARGGMPTVCQAQGQMFSLSSHLERTGMAHFGSVEVIARAKVPLVKFVDKLTDLRVDMSFENMTGIVANDTFQLWKAQFPAMPIIVTIIKQFLMMRGLNEVVNGGIGGFTVTCLVTSLLQNMPRLQMKEFLPENNLGEMLLEFLDYYGNQFDYARTVIRMNPPGLLTKAEVQSTGLVKINRFEARLAIIDPNQPSNDISGGSKRIQMIFDKFAHAREEMVLAMRSTSRKSLLDWMLGGNYNTFRWHRERLRSLHVSKFGDVDVEVGKGRDEQIVPKQKTLPRIGDASSKNDMTHLTPASSALTGSVSQLSVKPSRSLDELELADNNMFGPWKPVSTVTDVKEGPRQPVKTAKIESRKSASKSKQVIAPDVSRAITLKKKYPHANIPEGLSKKDFKALQKKIESRVARLETGMTHDGANNVAPKNISPVRNRNVPMVTRSQAKKVAAESMSTSSLPAKPSGKLKRKLKSMDASSLLAKPPGNPKHKLKSKPHWRQRTFKKNSLDNTMIIDD